MSAIKAKHPATQAGFYCVSSLQQSIYTRVCVTLPARNVTLVPAVDTIQVLPKPGATDAN